MLVIKEHLKHEFTGEELVTIARQQARHHDNLAQHEQELEQIRQAYKAKISEEEIQIRICNNQISSGYEIVMVECLVLKFRPTKDEKLLVRLDTGRIAKQSKLAKEERQLTIDAPTEPYVASVTLLSEGTLPGVDAFEVPVTQKELARLIDADTFPVYPVVIPQPEPEEVPA